MLESRSTVTRLLDRLCLSRYNLAWTRGCSSVVERLPSKQDIVGSNPITRSAGRWRMANGYTGQTLSAICYRPSARGCVSGTKSAKIALRDAGPGHQAGAA